MLVLSVTTFPQIYNGVDNYAYIGYYKQRLVAHKTGWTGDREMPRSFTNWFLATMVCGVFFLILFGIAYLLSGRSIGTFGETVFVSIIVGAVGGSLITGLIDEKGLMLATVQDGLKGDFKNFFVNTPYEQIGSWQKNISRKEWDHLQKQYGQI